MAFFVFILHACGMADSSLPVVNCDDWFNAWYQYDEIDYYACSLVNRSESNNGLRMSVYVRDSDSMKPHKNFSSKSEIDLIARVSNTTVHDVYYRPYSGCFIDRILINGPDNSINISGDCLMSNEWLIPAEDSIDILVRTFHGDEFGFGVVRGQIQFSLDSGNSCKCTQWFVY